MTMLSNNVDSFDTQLSLNETDRLGRWSEVIAEAVSSGDLLTIKRLNDALRSAARMVGIQLAQFLHSIQKNWQNFETDEEFETFAESQLHYSPQTIRKYTGIWEVIFERDLITEERKKLLLGFPMQTLYLLKAAIQDGDLNETQWKHIEAAQNRQEIQGIIREARGQHTSSGSSLRITMDEVGTLYAFRGKEEKAVCGFLSVESGVQSAQDAIDRITRAANILRR